MAIEVLTDAFVSINAVDLSDHIREVRIDDGAELPTATAMGDKGIRRLGGLRDWSAVFEFYQDFDAAKVDATLDPLIAVQTALKVRKSKTDAISATNPEYQGNGMIESLPLVAGSVGEEHTISVTMRGSDSVALIRAVV